MLRKLVFWSTAIFFSLVSAVSLADMTILDGLGASKTLKNFVCETTKLCSSTVIIKSDGTEIGTNAAPIYFDMSSSGNMATALANGVQTAGSAVSTSLVAWGINVAGNARQPTGVNPSGSVYATQIDIASIAGTTRAVNSGNKDNGTARGVIATDQVALPAWGQGATGASVPAGATMAGLRAQNAEATAASNGQLVAPAADLTGKQITMPYSNPENSLTGLITTAMTGTSDTAVTGMGAQGSGVRNYITGCVISNSHATVGTDVVLKDGSGGSVLWTFPAAAAYGGATFPFPTPIKTTANTALYAANITTGSSTKVSCTGYKGV